MSLGFRVGGSPHELLALACRNPKHPLFLVYLYLCVFMYTHAHVYAHREHNWGRRNFRTPSLGTPGTRGSLRNAPGAWAPRCRTSGSWRSPWLRPGLERFRRHGNERFRGFRVLGV